VLLNKSKSRKGVCRFLSPKTNPTHQGFPSSKVVVQLKEVLECYHVSGDYDYILKIVVRDMEAYRGFSHKQHFSILVVHKARL
jgi:Lrp/AsnC family leucine-responsive transcriptional regulator